jgi:hypothetical protein
VLAGEQGAISADVLADVDIADNGVAVSQRVREAVRSSLQDAIDAGDTDRMRLLAQVATDLNLTEDNGIAPLLTNVQTLLDAQPPVEIPVVLGTPSPDEMATMSQEWSGSGILGAINSGADGVVSVGMGEADTAAFRAGGTAAGQAFADGLTESGATVDSATAALAGVAAGYLVGQSPPPVGPLSTIDEGAMNLIAAWLAPFLTADLTPVELLANKVMNVIALRTLMLTAVFNGWRNAINLNNQAVKLITTSLARLPAEHEQSH